MDISPLAEEAYLRRPGTLVEMELFRSGALSWNGMGEWDACNDIWEQYEGILNQLRFKVFGI